MNENIMVCNCMQVSFGDIQDALATHSQFSDVLEAFDSVQEVTHCSTGCGGCHDKVMDIISDFMMGKVN